MARCGMAAKAPAKKTTKKASPKKPAKKGK